jgi:hypothetical protein
MTEPLARSIFDKPSLPPGLCRIYVLIDPLTGEIRYVGKTTRTLTTRLNGHKGERLDHHRSRWIAKLRRLGLAPSIELVQEVPGAWANDAERYWIAYYRAAGCSLINGTSGGDGMANPSPETRAKIGAANRARIVSAETRAKLSATRKGRHLSPETRAKLSATRKGRKVTPETRAKLRAVDPMSRNTPEHRAKVTTANRARIVSTETRAKLSATQKGRPRTSEHRAKLSTALRGRSFSAETRAKIAAAMIGKPGHNQGHKWTPEQKARLRDARVDHAKPNPLRAKQVWCSKPTQCVVDK